MDDRTEQEEQHSCLMHHWERLENLLDPKRLVRCVRALIDKYSAEK